MRNRDKLLLLLFLIVIASILFYKGISSRTFQLYGGIINRVQTSEKVVALTFDDGPSTHTGEVLQILQKHNVHATFFLIGSELERNMEAGKMIALAGNEIGNHSYSHSRLIFSTYATIKREVDLTDSLIYATGYKGAIFFRPPGCKKFLELPYYLHKHNRQTITWDVEPESEDNKMDADDITKTVVNNVKPGSIVLLHVMTESRTECRKSLDGIITALEQKGYRFVTVSELLRFRNIH